ncbi:hypothetical protein, partial [Pseudonocardia pini]|uniref:hypothetical protein n=1 Tax=Pseudonocardia pini TaxID=2758030 RepID=UPI001C68B46E
MGKEHGYMPERQHSPGEVDERRTEGSGATTATDASQDPARARRTDSPRGDALFAPSVEPTEPTGPTGPAGSEADSRPEESGEAPAEQATAPTSIEQTSGDPQVCSIEVGAVACSVQQIAVRLRGRTAEV